jgi:hypothetical protein
MLRSALEKVLKIDGPMPRITMFLDALDEYDGAPQRIINFVRSMTESRPGPCAQFRICLSSRPWNAFNDAFGDHLGFTMQDQNVTDLLNYIGDLMHGSPSIRSMLHSSDSRTQRLILDLKDSILVKADGVFLWVRLVMQDLLDAAAEGATARELTKVLADLPDELKELYRRILQRIDQKHREETYFMLETLLRSHSTMPLAVFWPVVRCAPSNNLQESVDALLEGISEFEVGALSRRIKSRCGGLIEVVPGFQAHPPFVRLMHQSVRDFLSQPGFQSQLMEPKSVFTTANGYSFLYRHCLASLRAFELGLGLDRPKSELLRTCLNSARRAELSTGRRERRLLDSVPDSTFALCFDLASWCDSKLRYEGFSSSQYWPVDSKLSFAVVADLRLFMSDVLGENGISSSTGGQLLHVLVDVITDPISSDWSDWWTLSEESTFSLIDRVPMVDLLLRHGPDLGAMRYHLTAFQSLYRPLWPPSPSVWERPRFRNQMVDTVICFLDHGADPQTDIYWSCNLPKRWGMKTKATHASFSERLLSRFLRAGFDIDCLDARGATPLDSLVWYVDMLLKPPNEFDRLCALDALREMYRCTRLLIQHGGHLTSAVSADSARNFLDWLRVADFAVDEGVRQCLSTHAEGGPSPMSIDDPLHVADGWRHDDPTNHGGPS